MTIDEKLRELRSDMDDYQKSAVHYKKARKIALRQIRWLRTRILDIEDIRNNMPACCVCGQPVFNDPTPET